MRVCLIKAGKFLLGLDTSHIISFLSVDNLNAEKIKETDSTFLLLESFLAQKHLDVSGSEVIILKNKFNKKHLALLIDKILGEIKLPDRFEPLPRLYPELAAKCCPKIFMHEDQIVLLLDPKQLSIIHKALKTDHGLIALNDLTPVDQEVEQEDTQPDNSNTSTAKNETAQPKSETNPKPETEIDDKTISKIVSWTFDQYIQFDSNEKIIISVEQLPPGLIQQQGLSNESLQQLIDQTILKCEKTRYQTMKNEIKNKLKEINF